MWTATAMKDGKPVAQLDLNARASCYPELMRL